MKRLLEHLVHRLDFLYLDPSYRFVDSWSSGNAFVDAWVVLESDRVRWKVEADREQIVLSVAGVAQRPGAPWFWTSLVRQLLDGGPEVPTTVLTAEEADWVRSNTTRIEGLFADEPTSRATHQSLTGLMKSNAAARGWAPVRQ